MGHAHWLAFQIESVARRNASWMTWNTLLAVIPAVLAVVLFARAHRRTPAWWIGVGTFLLFLPNAPYVVTDLIHLRLDAARAPSDSVLVFGVLPIYALFVTVGVGCYVLSLHLVLQEVRSVHPGTPRWVVEFPLHALAALGIVLGRIARLNSWDTISSPHDTAYRVFDTLSWRGAPVAFVVVLFMVWASFTILRALAVAVGAWADRSTATLRDRRDRRGADGSAVLPEPVGKAANPT